MRSDKEPYRAGTVSFPDRVKTTGCETRSTSRLGKTRHGTVESVKVTKR